MLRIAGLVWLLVMAGIGAVQAGVVIDVDKSSQRLSVSVDGVQLYDWPVSTARKGYETPNGVYRPQRLEREWHSRQYDWSPMPYSIFFDGGYAIHGSYEIAHLGRPASHGCIRLSPKHAAILFTLVKKNRHDTRIVVTGERSPASGIARERQTRSPGTAVTTIAPVSPQDWIALPPQHVVRCTPVTTYVYGIGVVSELVCRE